VKRHAPLDATTSSSPRVHLTACLLALAATATCASGISLVTRAHVLSLAAGQSIPGGPRRYLNAADARLLDVAVGPRVSPRWAVLAAATLAEYPADYTRTTDLFFLAATVGVTAVYAPSLCEQPRRLVLAASLRGTNGWGIYNDARFLEAALEASVTLKVFNPSVEVGWRRDFVETSGVEPPPGRPGPEDRLRLLVRVALGGVYELQSTR
jgi:hypothetical protein